MPDYGLFGAEHVRQYEATGGKVGHDWNGAPVLVLQTTGRRSGEIRKFPLIYGRDDNDYVIVASKGGAPEHPGWSCWLQLPSACLAVAFPPPGIHHAARR